MMNIDTIAMKISSKISLSSKMKNVAKISSGTMIGQAISIISLPIITRIYGASIMGIWASIFSVSLIASAFSDLGLSSSIMVEKDEKELPVIYQVVTFFSVILSFLTGLFVLPYYIFVKGNTLKEAVIYSVLVAIYTITVVQINTCYTWLNRYKNYNVLMKNPIINNITVTLFSILLGVLGFKQYGYFIGIIMGQFFTLYNMKSSLPKLEFHFLRYRVPRICCRYIDFVKFQVPSSLFFQLRQQLPNLLIGTFFGDTTLGYYSLALKVLNIPITNIGHALGKVFFQTISELKLQGQNIASFVMRNISRVTKLALIPLLAVFAFGDMAAVVVFGTDFIIVGYMLRILAFRTFFTLISTSIQGLDIVLEKQKFSMLITICQSTTCVLSVLVGYYFFHDIYVVSVLITVTFIIAQLYYYCRLIAIMESSKLLFLRQMLLSLLFISICSYGLRIAAYQAIRIFQINYFQWFRI